MNQGFKCEECGDLFTDPSSFAKHIAAHVDEDPGYCGLGVSTGKWDPFWKQACKSHDQSFNELKAKMRSDNGLKVMLEFQKNVGVTFLQSLYGVVAAPFYAVFGGIGGLFRWSQQKRRLGMEPRLINKDEWPNE